ncbi:hypothetical protein MPSEU_000483800 [Mayamaea pseudoterrestris]|nr:hypothetical protein MPSEU_000483800 [Mayamaea pseudoterrestris]
MLRSSNTIKCVAASLIRKQTRCSVLQLHPVTSPRPFSSAASSNLLGYSPMAPQVPFNIKVAADASKIPTATDVTTSGGVWAPSSAKREKLKELQGELAEHKDKSKNLTLDDLATNEERLDLYLADGLLAIVSTVEQSAVYGDAVSDNVIAAITQGMDELFQTDQLTQVQWEATLTDISKLLDLQLSTLPPERCLKDVRDFYVPPRVVDDDVGDAHKPAVQIFDSAGLPEHAHAYEAIIRFRLLLAQAAVDHFKVSWTTLTMLSDQDVDRGAVTGTLVDKQAATLDAKKLQRVISAYLRSDCALRAEAVWNLMDRDNDGLLDETEMNLVCILSFEPVRMALTRVFMEALDASPVRVFSGSIDGTNLDTNVITPPKRPSWRQRRREVKERKRLAKLFQRSVHAHFIDEVEMPHRMRCIYAWANKKHQENKVDSVLVDDAGWSGRKRYVELYVTVPG